MEVKLLPLPLGKDWEWHHRLVGVMGPHFPVFLILVWGRCRLVVVLLGCCSGWGSSELRDFFWPWKRLQEPFHGQFGSKCWEGWPQAQLEGEECFFPFHASWKSFVSSVQSCPTNGLGGAVRNSSGEAETGSDIPGSDESFRVSLHCFHFFTYMSHTSNPQ